MKKSYPRFIFRTIHSGRIKFDKLLWEPDEPTSRLDGRRFAFGVYAEGPHSNPVRRLDMLCLWSSVEAYKAVNKSEEAYDEADAKDTELLAPDGYFRQYWWTPIREDAIVKKVKDG